MQNLEVNMFNSLIHSIKLRIKTQIQIVHM
jgi:hypothetical protein